MLDKRLGINLTGTTRLPSADLVPHDCFGYLFVFNNIPKDKQIDAWIRSVRRSVSQRRIWNRHRKLSSLAIQIASSRFQVSNTAKSKASSLPPITVSKSAD